MAHTPGPWAIRRSVSGYPYQIYAVDWKPGPGGIINITRWGAISLPSSDEAEANARLIAAAPETKRQRDALLAALKEIANGEGAYGWQAHEYKQIARSAIADCEADNG